MNATRFCNQNRLGPQTSQKMSRKEEDCVIREEDTYVVYFAERSPYTGHIKYAATWRHPKYPTLWFSYMSEGREALVQFVHPSLLRNTYTLHHMGKEFPEKYETTNNWELLYRDETGVARDDLFPAFSKLVKTFLPATLAVIKKPPTRYTFEDDDVVAAYQAWGTSDVTESSTDGDTSVSESDA